MKLNQVQQSVIKHNGNGLVFASAGTGKTETLSKKILYCIEAKLAKPNEILCLTFTNRGCAEMIEKIKKNIKQESKEITIKTFHSFCYGLIKKYNSEIELINTDYVIFDEDDCLKIINLILDEENISASLAYKFINYIKQSIISKRIFTGDLKNDAEETIKSLYQDHKKLNEQIKKLDYRAKSNFVEILNLASAIKLFNKYKQILDDSFAYDFNDLEYFANVSLNNDEFLHKIQKTYKYIFVDEAQDTSYCEYKLIEKIGEYAKVYLCGDFFQTIYEWRGSQPKLIIKDFTRKYNPKKFIFNINYRCTQNLANSSFSFLKNIFPKLVKETYDCEFSSYNENDGDLVKMTYCKDIDEEAKFIDYTITNNNDNDSCVLVRTNKYAIALSEKLRALNPDKYFLVQDYQFFKRNEIKEILAFIRLIINPFDNVSLERIITKYVKGFGEKKILNIISKDAYGNGIRISDLLDTKTHNGCGDQYDYLISKLDKDEVVILDTETTGLNIGEDEIIQFAGVKINKNFEIVDEINILIKNKKSVGESYLIHGISDELLKEKGINKTEALRKIINFTNNSLIIGHNVTFDINMINSELSKAKIDLLPLNFYDTYLISKRFIKNAANYKLEYLSKKLNLEHISNHDALDDVKATTYLLKYLILNYIIPTKEIRIKYIQKYLSLFYKLANKIEEFREMIHKMKFEEFLYKVINDLNIEKIYKNSPNAIYNINYLKQLVNVIIDENLDTFSTITKILNLSSLSTSDLDAIYKKKNLIPIITVHQSKGCEFDNVYIAGVQDNMFPSYISTITNSLEEEKRLFYVAITRAKNKLFITIPNLDLKGYQKNPSPFLSCYEGKYIWVSNAKDEIK